MRIGGRRISFFGSGAVNGEVWVIMKRVFGYHSLFTLRGYWFFGLVMPGKVSVRNGDAGNPSRL